MMKVFAVLASVGLVAASVLGQDPAAPASEVQADLEADARSRTLELAGAFSNEGYKIRDGYWFAPIDGEHPQTLEVNLYAGNEYWFCAGVNPPGGKISIGVFDEKGTPVGTNEYQEGLVAAEGVEPAYSGKFYVQVKLLEGEKSDFCLVYCYK